MSQELAVRHGAWSDTPRPLALLLQIVTVAEADVRKLMHDPMELFTRMLQPVLWLVVFAPLVSQWLASARADDTMGMICSAVTSEQPTSKHQGSPDPLSACGYCNLLAHHVPAPATAPTLAPVLIVLTSITVSAPPVVVPYAQFPSGRPRDPPVVS